MQEVNREELEKVGNFLLGENKKLSEPQIKVLLELLRKQEPLLKSELFDSELAPYIRAQGVSDVLDLPLYQNVIDTFCRTKMAHKRKRVQELLSALNPGYKPKKTGFFSKLFGGGD